MLCGIAQCLQGECSSAISFKEEYSIYGLPKWLSSKESACQCRRCKRFVPSLGQEDPLEKEMATHSSILAWEVPWTEDLDGL